MKITIGPVAPRVGALACLVFFLSLVPLTAHEVGKHAIDVAMSKASESDPSTAGQTKAIGQALKEWDKLLNESYQKLTKKLEPDAAKALRESQRAWVVWRDKELKNLDAIYSRLEGTMYVPMGAYARMNLTRQRALQLERLAELTGDFK